MRRIRFTRELTEPASGDHPELLLAYAGEDGILIRRYDDGFASVKPANGPEFLCETHDYILLDQ